ncbi:HlyC/CorC family transporter [Streptosporangiaceae bacterium NEAU-GS5]|nr:HlyC/CorC family transporter [Streptosporangiaceae bacterium NEAU-GS5]
MILDLFYLLGAAVLIAANAVFVAAEFSLVTVERAQVAELAEAGDRGAQGMQSALRRLSFHLSGAQLGITITSLLLGVLAEPAIADLIRPAFTAMGLPEGLGTSVAATLALFIATVIQMILGELVPKNAALAKPLLVARLSIPPQRVFSAVFSPLIRACNATANAIVRVFGAEPQDELASARSPDELSLLVRLSAEAGALPPSTAAMLRRALRFGDKTAGEAMTPRTFCVTVPELATVADFLDVASRERHLRLPVVGAEVDDIVGIAALPGAYAIDEAARSSTPVTQIVRHPVRVPESVALTTVQEQLIDADAEMAVVVDEYGGFAGVITIEDLAEELVGELADEYDLPEEDSAAPEPARLAPETSVALPALLRADEVEERTGFRMPEGPYETLAGLVIAHLGRLAERGDEVAVAGWTLRVDSVRGHRIDQISLTAPRREGETS